MPKVLARRRAITVNLREELRLATSVVEAAARVERPKPGLIIIRGVKAVGRTSPNTHGIEGIDGTEYTEEAFRRALPLYEGLKVNANHPPKDRPGSERSTYDRLGKLCNVAVRWNNADPDQDGVFGDLYMIASHPLAESLANAALNDELADCFGLSHNSRGRGEIRNRKYVVTELPEVRSVDVVADAGTTRSLFESRTITMTLRALIEGLKDEPFKSVFLPLLEEDYGDMAVSEGEDWKQDLVAAIGKLVASEDDGDHSMAKKIMNMLRPGAAEPAETEESEEDEGEKDKTEPKNDDKEEKLESLERELKTLKTEKSVRSLCESLKFSPSETQLEALALLPEGKRRTLIKTWLPIVAPKTGPGVRPLTESRDAEKRTPELLFN